LRRSAAYLAGRLLSRITPPSARGRVLDAFWLLHERHFRRFVFIHINKTAGTSVTHALGIPWARHETAADVRARLGEAEWERRFKFTFVRNPFDRVVSQFEYRVATNQEGLRDAGLSFDDWVEWTYGRRQPPYYEGPLMFMPQTRWICDDEGRSLIDFTGRFESLADDFAQICSRLGRKSSLPHMKRSAREAYPSYYSDRSRELIATWYADDLREFGYDFDGSGT
jgi:hypothetical protein